VAPKSMLRSYKTPSVPKLTAVPKVQEVPDLVPTIALAESRPPCVSPCS